MEFFYSRLQMLSLKAGFCCFIHKTDRQSYMFAQSYATSVSLSKVPVPACLCLSYQLVQEKAYSIRGGDG